MEVNIVTTTQVEYADIFWYLAQVYKLSFIFFIFIVN